MIRIMLDWICYTCYKIADLDVRRYERKQIPIMAKVTIENHCIFIQPEGEDQIVMIGITVNTPVELYKIISMEAYPPPYLATVANGRSSD